MVVEIADTYVRTCTNTVYTYACKAIKDQV